MAPSAYPWFNHIKHQYYLCLQEEADNNEQGSKSNSEDELANTDRPGPGRQNRKHTDPSQPGCSRDSQYLGEHGDKDSKEVTGKDVKEKDRRSPLPGRPLSASGFVESPAEAVKVNQRCVTPLSKEHFKDICKLMSCII